MADAVTVTENRSETPQNLPVNAEAQPPVTETPKNPMLDIEAQLSAIEGIISQIALMNAALASEIRTELGRELQHLRAAAASGSLSPDALQAVIAGFRSHIENVRTTASSMQAGDFAQIADAVSKQMQFEMMVDAEYAGISRYHPNIDRETYRDSRLAVSRFMPNASPEASIMAATDYANFTLNNPHARDASRLFGVASDTTWALYEAQIRAYHEAAASVRDDILANPALSERDRRVLSNYFENDAHIAPLDMDDLSRLIANYKASPSPETLQALTAQYLSTAEETRERRRTTWAQIQENTDILEAGQRAQVTRELQAVGIDPTDLGRNWELLTVVGADGRTGAQVMGEEALARVMRRYAMNHGEANAEMLYDPAFLFSEHVLPAERAAITLMRDSMTLNTALGVQHFAAHAARNPELFASITNDVVHSLDGAAAFDLLQRCNFLPNMDSLTMEMLRARFENTSVGERQEFMRQIGLSADAINAGDMTAAQTAIQGAMSRLMGGEERTGELQIAQIFFTRAEQTAARGEGLSLGNFIISSRPPATESPTVGQIPIEDIQPYSEEELQRGLEEGIRNLPTFVAEEERPRGRGGVGGIVGTITGVVGQFGDAISTSDLERMLSRGGFSTFGASISSIDNEELRRLLLLNDSANGNNNQRYNIAEIKRALEVAGVDITTINTNGDDRIDQAELAAALHNLPTATAARTESATEGRTP